jgi:hypothetical protein
MAAPISSAQVLEKNQLIEIDAWVDMRRSNTDDPVGGFHRQGSLAQRVSLDQIAIRTRCLDFVVRLVRGTLGN